MMQPSASELFRHVSAEKAVLYRRVMDTSAAANRQFRLHLRPDEVLAEGEWGGDAPTLEEIQQALTQLAAWGNLESQPDTARVASLSDFYSGIPTAEVNGRTLLCVVAAGYRTG